MTASQHMVKANGLRFRLMVDGPADGDMFILLHGFPEGAESWSKQVDALARAGLLAVAPDLRGYGLSDAPEGVESYSIDHLSDDVRYLITSFGRTNAHVAGHDWGAMVAWYFAGKYPEMTKTLTALSVPHPAALAAAGHGDEDQQARSRYVGLFLIEGKAEEVLAADDYRRLRSMFSLGPNPDAVPTSIVDHFTRSVSRPGRLTAALNYYRANLRAGGAAWETPIQIGPITMPTVLLWGDQDPALGRRAAEATAEHVQGEYRLEVLEGAGHWLQFERPAEVSLALTGAASK
ncbi:MAG TPA: alpha/beta hydrolase [Candidatus Dormibacteraeota bacterium]|jgi:pimeloyl-ACP methyl ester carboxylesterase|nr:alpha/beta hydrolase [Candidatus Dormibacteraeota bacterium]